MHSVELRLSSNFSFGGPTCQKWIKMGQDGSTVQHRTRCRKPRPLRRGQKTSKTPPENDEMGELSSFSEHRCFRLHGAIVTPQEARIKASPPILNLNIPIRPPPTHPRRLSFGSCTAFTDASSVGPVELWLPPAPMAPESVRVGCPVDGGGPAWMARKGCGVWSTWGMQEWKSPHNGTICGSFFEFHSEQSLNYLYRSGCRIWLS